MGTVNDFLFSYLDTIDERLLEYLDDANELSLDAVKKLRLYASSLLDGTLSPDHLAEDWADWFQLALAFVLAYGTDELEKLGDAWTPRKGKRASPSPRRAGATGLAQRVRRSVDQQLHSHSPLRASAEHLILTSHLLAVGRRVRRVRQQ
jgi:hypothetical protein